MRRECIHEQVDKWKERMWWSTFSSQTIGKSMEKWKIWRKLANAKNVDFSLGFPLWFGEKVKNEWTRLATQKKPKLLWKSGNSGVRKIDDRKSSFAIRFSFAIWVKIEEWMKMIRSHNWNVAMIAWSLLEKRKTFGMVMDHPDWGWKFVKIWEDGIVCPTLPFSRHEDLEMGCASSCSVPIIEFYGCRKKLFHRVLRLNAHFCLSSEIQSLV